MLNRCLLTYAQEAQVNPPIKQAEEIKQAIPAWGGGTVYAQSPYGPGLEAGYSHLMGLIPVPHAGVRLGGRRFGVSAGLPYLGVDYGREPGLGAGWNQPESIWSHLLSNHEEEEGQEQPEDKKEKKERAEEPKKKPAKPSIKVATTQAILATLWG